MEEEQTQDDEQSEEDEDPIEEGEYSLFSFSIRYEKDTTEPLLID